MNLHKEKIIDMLENSRETYLSGIEIAKKCEISRNMVWKYINALIEEGNIIEKGRKGYKLVTHNTAISSQKIKKHLIADDYTFEIFETIDSTNTYLKKAAELGAKEKTVVISSHQSGGKGRMGRSFYSPDNSGIYMSVLLRPDISVNDSVLVTTCAAVSVCKAIEKICDKKTDIKWVNDIFLDGKKVCGILTEAAINLESNKPDYIVLGIGLNLYIPQNGFPDEIKNIATALFKDKTEADLYKNILISEILNFFFNDYKNILEKDFYNEYAERMFLIGKRVKVLSQNEYVAEVVGVDKDFSLMVKNDNNEIIKLNSGEVSTSLY